MFLVSLIDRLSEGRTPLTPQLFIPQPQDGLAPLQTVESHELRMALLQGGANPSVADKEGNTFMHTTDSPELMAALLTHGGDPNVTNKVSGDRSVTYLGICVLMVP